MSKTFKLFGMLILGVAFYLVIGLASSASAYENVLNGDTLVNGGVTVRGDLYADHNNLFFNPVGYSGVNPTIDFKTGDSMIKEMGDLYILSDDYVHIGPSVYASPLGRVLIQDPLEIAARARTASGWLEAGTLETTDLLVKNNASVGGMFVANGSLTFGPSTTADFTNATITGFGTGGMTLAGDLDMDGYDIENIGYLDAYDGDFSTVTIDGTGGLNLGGTADINMNNRNINGGYQASFADVYAPDLYSSNVIASSGNLALTASAGSVLLGGQNTVRIVAHGGDITLDPSGEVNVWSNLDMSGNSINNGGSATFNDFYATNAFHSANFSSSGDLNFTANGGSGDIYFSATNFYGLPAALGALPLSGGTMTGSINMGGNNIWNLNNLYVDGTLDVDGIASFDNDIYTNNIYPNADATYDIGSGSARFNEAFFDQTGGVYVGNYNGGNYISLDNGGVSANGGYSLYLESAGDIYLYPTGATYSYNLYPNANSTYDLGTLDDEWLNGYIDNLYTHVIEPKGPTDTIGLAHPFNAVYATNFYGYLNGDISGSANYATTAGSADYATSAGSASTADYATDAGNADTLDGYDSDSFAMVGDLANYLPLAGGTMAGAINMGDNNIWNLNNLYVDGTLDVDGMAYFDSGIDVSSTAYFQSSIDVDGTAYLDGGADLGNNDIDNVYELNATYANVSELDANGGYDDSINGSTVDANVSTHGGIYADSASYFQSSIDVDGMAYFDSGIDVASSSYFQSTIDVDGMAYMDGGITGTLTGNADTATNADYATNAGNASTVTDGVYTTGSYADPSWITSLDASKITGTITITGYLKTDGTIPMAGNLDMDGYNIVDVTDIDNTGALTIGGTNATSINIGHSGITTSFAGDVDFSGATSVKIPNGIATPTAGCASAGDYGKMYFQTLNGGAVDKLWVCGNTAPGGGDAPGWVSVNMSN